jgi:hypothetical protein
MAAAQQKRRAAHPPRDGRVAAQRQNKMNPATKALLSARLKAYWAKRRAANKK